MKYYNFRMTEKGRTTDKPVDMVVVGSQRWFFSALVDGEAVSCYAGASVVWHLMRTGAVRLPLSVTTEPKPGGGARNYVLHEARDRQGRSA